MPKWIRRRVHERETERYTGGGGKRRSTRPWQRDRGDEGVVCALSAGNQSRISDAQPVATCERRSMRSRIPVYDGIRCYFAPWKSRRRGHGFLRRAVSAERKEKATETTLSSRRLIARATRFEEKYDIFPRCRWPNKKYICI